VQYHFSSSIFVTKGESHLVHKSNVDFLSFEDSIFHQPVVLSCFLMQGQNPDMSCNPEKRKRTV